MLEERVDDLDAPGRRHRERIHRQPVVVERVGVVDAPAPPAWFLSTLTLLRVMTPDDQFWIAAPSPSTEPSRSVRYSNVTFRALGWISKSRSMPIASALFSGGVAAVDDRADAAPDRDRSHDVEVARRRRVVVHDRNTEREGAGDREGDRVVTGERVRLQDRGAQRAPVPAEGAGRADAVAGVHVGRVGRACRRRRPPGGEPRSRLPQPTGRRRQAPARRRDRPARTRSDRGGAAGAGRGPRARARTAVCETAVPRPYACESRGVEGSALSCTLHPRSNEPQWITLRRSLRSVDKDFVRRR